MPSSFPSSFSHILNVTRSGMFSRLLDLEVTSHNLSNINTTGYKRSRADFQELLSAQQLNGTQVRVTQRLMEQGSLRTTDNPLDFAISGAGFFAVQMPDGRTAYTRDGQFYLDANNQLVNGSGFRLVWEGEVPEGATNVHVNPDGSVMALQNGLWAQVGDIQLNQFANPSGLVGFGQNLWLATAGSGEAQTGTPGEDGLGIVQSGAVEQSNVNLSEEMVRMVSLQRSFEMSLRTFQQTDQMLSQAIHLRKG